MDLYDRIPSKMFLENGGEKKLFMRILGRGAVIPQGLREVTSLQVY